MPYGKIWEMDDIEARRKERREERDANATLMQEIIHQGNSQWTRYAGVGADILLVAAIILYWLVSSSAGLFVAILAIGFHIHWSIRWIYQHIRVTQINHVQDNLLMMELFDDLQEMLAKGVHVNKKSRAE